PTSHVSLHTLSLHDALPILVVNAPTCVIVEGLPTVGPPGVGTFRFGGEATRNVEPLWMLSCFPVGLSFIVNNSQPVPQPLFHLRDRKSTRLNSSHVSMSYAV